MTRSEMERDSKRVDNLIRHLAERYAQSTTEAAEVAMLCDKILDPSGNLLGWVRDVKSGRALPGRNTVDPDYSQTEMLEEACSLILRAIGEDPNREGLKDTPARFAKAWIDDWSAGYKQSVGSMTTFTQPADSSELIFQGPCSFVSFCEHHCAPFLGYAYVGYIPNGRIIGLSKIPRIIDIYSRRLQVQERLVAEVADAISTLLATDKVGVVMKARHTCMESRGIRRPGIVTTTSRLLGSMLTSDALRAEFYSMVAMAERQL